MSRPGIVQIGFRRSVFCRKSLLGVDGYYSVVIVNGNNHVESRILRRKDLKGIHKFVGREDQMKLNIEFDSTSSPLTRDLEFRLLKKKYLMGYERTTELVSTSFSRIEERLCRNFRHTITVDFPDHLKIVFDIKLKNFGIQDKEESSVFYQLFADEYQYEGVRRKVFSYVPSITLIKSISLLSKSIRKLVKDSKFSDFLRIQKSQVNEVFDACEKYGINRISVGKLMFPNPLVAKTSLFVKNYQERKVNNELVKLVIRKSEYSYSFCDIFAILNHFQGLKYLEIHGNISKRVITKQKRVELQPHRNLQIFKFFGQVDEPNGFLMYSIARNCIHIRQLSTFEGDHAIERERKFPVFTKETKMLLQMRNLRIERDNKGIPIISTDGEELLKLPEEVRSEIEPLEENPENPRKPEDYTTLNNPNPLHIIPTWSQPMKFYLTHTVYNRKTLLDRENETLPEGAKKKVLKDQFELNHETFLDHHGFHWKVGLYRLGTYDEDVLYFQSKNNEGQCVCSLRVFSPNGVTQRREKRIKFTTSRGHVVDHFSAVNMEENEVCPFRVQIKVKEFLPERLLTNIIPGQLAKARGSALGYGTTSASTDLGGIRLEKFDRLYNGDRTYRKKFRILNQEWEMLLKRDYNTGFYSLYFHNCYNDAMVIFCTLKLIVNNITRSIVDQLFVNHQGYGWDSLCLDDNGVFNVAATFEMNRIMSIEEYEEYKRRQEELSRQMIESARENVGKGYVTKTLTIPFGGYHGHQSVTWEAHGLKWRILLQKDRGKYKRGAIFFYCDFWGKYVIQAEYNLEIKSGENSSIQVQSTSANYYEHRGWGFDELEFPPFYDEKSGKVTTEGNYKVNASVRVLRIMKEEEKHAELAEIVKGVELGLPHEFELVIPTKGSQNSYQSECFKIQGIPMYVEFYPNGMEDPDRVCVCVYHTLKVYVLLGEYTLSVWHEKEKVSFSRTITTDKEMVKFDSLCEKNIDQDWKMKIVMKVKCIRKIFM